MRPILAPILAFAILLLALSGAEPKREYSSLLADYLHAAGGDAARSPIEIESAIGRSDRLPVVSLQPHDTGIVASVDTTSDRPVEASLGDLCNAVLTSAQDNDLPIPFFANLLWQESNLRGDTVSSKGALGIAQFMPETAAEVGLANPFDPMQAIPASARFLRELRMEFGNLGFVAAAYNAGAQRVIDWLERRGDLPRETRDYVVRITGLSVDGWRRIAVSDAALTFVQPLPCRSLPAFASLEQAQAKPQQAERDVVAAKATPDKTAPNPAGGHHQAAERRPVSARRTARSAGAEAAHHPRAAREKQQSV
jgi:Transglycosylase SLT domain